MVQPFRFATGGIIDRTKPLRFTFDGKSVDAFAGDTVASALIAGGIRLVGRSFKYRRPRGILAHGSDETNALVGVWRGPGRSDPNNRATVVEVSEGLAVISQNRWPSLRHDLGAINDRLSPLFAAGFYYKTFMWPRAFWRGLYEPAIRALAGLGSAPPEADADRYLHRHTHCEVLVVGAGPAGLAAALAASERGADRVVLVDEQHECGGSLLHDITSVIEGRPGREWVRDAVAALRGRANVTLLTRTTAFGYYNHNHIALVERLTDHANQPSHLPRERLWQVRAGRVVLATGAHERPLVFRNNDRPGIMLAETVRAYVNRYAVAPGRRIVIATSGASAYQAAADARSAGLDVTLVDLRARPGAELAWLSAQGIEVLTGCRLVEAGGRHAVAALVVEDAGGARRTLACDCIGMSGGWTPSVHLFSQSRGTLRHDPMIDAFVPGVSRQAECSAGAANGAYDLAQCVTEGRRAGGGTADPVAATPSLLGFEPTDAFPGAKAFLDFQNDVTADDVRLALREGFESIEHVKRYTTTGMATDQGKTSNMNALRLVARTLGRPVSAIGTTKFRPPYTPVSFGALAGAARGALLDPLRKTPIDGWADARGAMFENVGLWRRAWYFPNAGEDMHSAVNRECRAVRNGAGLFDASTLGKIEVVGPDAAEFLNRIYVNGWNTLAPGRCRYGLMLKEDGYVLDDGVVARMAADRFHVTTTTGGAARVLAHMEDYLQTEWADLEVFLTSVTEQWAVIALQGTKAREILKSLVEGIDLDAFAHMSFATGRICGVPLRLFRVSFTGEPSYEINVPAGHALEVWEAVFARGEPHGITPYGTEAMHVLRAERGFIMVGQETDGTVTPDDLGLGRMIAKSKRDFVGKRSLARPDLVAAGRKQLVGLLTDETDLVLEEGAQIVEDLSGRLPMPMLGHVTSAHWSETCGRSIALALVAGGRARKGTCLHVTTPDGFTAVRVTDPVFFDPSGVRANG